MKYTTTFYEANYDQLRSIKNLFTTDCEYNYDFL